MASMSKLGLSKCKLLAFIVTLLAGLAGGSGFSFATEASLIDSLQGGGYVIYFRHGPTEWSQQDYINAANDWRSCDPARIRQLSEYGRDVARRVGIEIRRLKIPIGEIFSSEYCRCVETAQLLGLGQVQTTPDLINVRAADFLNGREALKQRVRQRLATLPPAGSNTILVAHGNLFLLAVDDGEHPVEAGAAIVRPDGEGGFSIIAMVRPEQWADFQSDPTQRDQ